MRRQFQQAVPVHSVCKFVVDVPLAHFDPLQVLLATLSDNVVVSKQTGKVRDKDRTWDSVKKSLLGNINGFLEELKVGGLAVGSVQAALVGNKGCAWRAVTRACGPAIGLTANW